MRVLLCCFFLLPCAAAQCLTATFACTEKVPSQASGPWIHVYRSHALTGDVQPGVRRAFVMIHGASRNADDYYTHAMASAITAGALNDTVIVAPWFKASSGACRDATEPGEASWTCEGWKSGLASTAGGPTSYEFIDRLMDAFGDRQRFPNLDEIIVAGHSAGGQFVQRYLGATRTDGEPRISVRYVVANPSSYLYLNNLRLSNGGSCAADGTCTGTFSKYWDAENCTTYNRYKYGMEGLAGYVEKAGAATVLEQYSRKNVTYMVGAQDNIRDSGLEMSCPAVAQGANRNERGIVYWNYIRRQFKADHKLVIVNGCGHSASCMFATPAGAKTVFPGANSTARQ